MWIQGGGGGRGGGGGGGLWGYSGGTEGYNEGTMYPTLFSPQRRRENGLRYMYS